MKATYSTLMQSKFFNPAFNSAIFDGPVRIYFAQFHESLALKIYFNLQQKFASELQKAKELHTAYGKTLLVMLYPSADAFQMSFDSGPGLLGFESLEDDMVIGINGPFEDSQLDTVISAIADNLASWKIDGVQTSPMLEAQL